MGNLPAADWLDELLSLLQSVQRGLLLLLHRLGLTDDIHGQPAWPWGQRLSGENLLIDMGQARQTAVSLLLAAAALASLTVALALLARRRRRAAGVASAIAVAALALAPWPDARVLLVPANPASFHRSPTDFAARSVVQGGRVYARQCVACHGADGGGGGPLAHAQPVWPPDLAGPLLWRRADGDVFWAIRRGLRDRHGMPTMAGFGDRLSDDDTWAVIDYLKAQAAGQSLRRSGAWERPVALPDFAVRCDGLPPRPLSDWRARRQRVRLVVEGSDPPPLEDPRLATVLLRRASGAAPASTDCTADAPEAWEALALVAGAGAGDLAGTQLIADRDGWLRARSAPGRAVWSEDDLLCRSDNVAPQARVPMADGLGALLGRMDAEPVRFVKGGFVH